MVLIDGTWSQAKQILSRYPFLSPKPPSAGVPGGSGGGKGSAKKLAKPVVVPRITEDGGGLRTAERDSGNGIEADPEGQEEEEEEAAGQGQGAKRDEQEGTGEGRAGKLGGAFCRAVQFRSAGVSSYGFRREPSKECLSTLESIAYTLEVCFFSAQPLPFLRVGAAAGTHSAYVSVCVSCVFCVWMVSRLDLSIIGTYNHTLG